MIDDALLNGSTPLPAEILRALRTLIRRARLMLMLRGAAAVLAIAMGSLLAIMGIDAAVTLFSPWPRVVLSGLFYGATLAATGWFLVRPLARSFTLAGMARLIESRHPEMQERLSSIVEILASSDAPEIRGSEALIDALKLEAIRDAGIVRPRDEVSIRRAVPFLAGVGAVGLALATVFVLRPRQSAYLLARAAAPLANLPNLYAADLAVAPGDLTVGEGSNLDISLRLANPKVTRAVIRRAPVGGREKTDDMTLTSAEPGQDRTFTVTLPALRETFRYRLHAGDALTRFYTVTVVPPPALRGVDLVFSYPEYSGIPMAVETGAVGTIRALAGTVVDVTAHLNKPVKSAALLLRTLASATNLHPHSAVVRAGGADYRFRIEVAPNLAGTWALSFTDEHGLSSAPFENTIQAIPDTAPLVSILHFRQKELRLNPMERVPVFYSARDDLGISRLELVFNIDGRSETRRLPVGEEGLRHRTAAGETAVDLSEAAFLRASRIGFQLRATDNKPAAWNGPQSGISETYTIVLDASVPAFDTQQLNAQESQIRDGLARARAELTAAATAVPKAEALARATAGAPELAAQLAPVDRQLAAAEQRLTELAETVRDGFFGDLDQRLDALVESSIGPARRDTEQVALAETGDDRTRLAASVRDAADRAVRQLDDVVASLDKVVPEVRRAVELSNLAERQDRLADQRRAMEARSPAPASNAPPPMKEEEWKAAQARIADELARLAKADPAAQQDLVDDVIRKAAALSQLARDLAQRQQDVSDETSRVAQLAREDRLLQELAREQALLAAQIRTNAALARTFEPMKQAAEAISTDQLQKAAALQIGAIAALTNSAAEFRHPKPPPEQEQQAAALQELIRAQDALRTSVGNAADQRAATLRTLAQEQARLAEKAQANPQTAAQAAPMNQAAQRLENDQPRQALTDQQTIAKALETAAAGFRNPSPTPEQQQQAQRIEDLARREEALQKTIDTLTEQRNQALQTLAAEQNKLTEDARQTPEAARAMRPMGRASDAIKTDQPRTAMAEQASAARALTEAAAKARATPSPTPEQQRMAQTLDELGRRQKDIEKKIGDLADQRNQALQNLVGEQARMAAEARSTPGAATQSDPMMRAAESIRLDRPKKAMPQMEQIAVALHKAAEQARQPAPTPAQLQEAARIADLAARQNQLARKVEAATAASKEQMRKIAADQDALAQQANANPAAAPQADPMKQAAGAVRTDQPRQAMPRQEAISKALTDAATLARLPPPPTAQQQRDAALADDLARRQNDIKTKTDQLALNRHNALAKLADDQAQLAAEAGGLPSTAPHAGAMAKAADAIKANELAAAKSRQESAASSLEATAQAMLNPTPPSEQQKDADTLKAMADRQGKVAEQTQGLADEAREAMKTVATQQEALARDASAHPAAADGPAGAMRNASTLLRTDKPRQALAQQIAAENALNDAVKTLQAADGRRPEAELLQKLATGQAAFRGATEKLLARQDEQIRALLTEEARIADSLKPIPQAAAALPEIARATQRLASSAPAEALPHLTQAHRTLETAAEALAHPPPEPARAQEARTIMDLARRQHALAGRLADAAQSRDNALQARVGEQMRAAAREQTAFAEDAARLADTLRQEAPQSDRLEKEAADAAREAARNLDKGDVAAAASDAIKAGASLNRLADRLEKAAQTPAADADATRAPAAMRLAETTRTAADRQRRLARTLIGLASDRPGADLLEAQRALAEEARTLVDSAHAVNEQARDVDLAPQTRQHTQQGADQATQALAQLEQAARMMEPFVPAEAGRLDLPPAISPQAQQAAQQPQAAAARALESTAATMDRVGSLPTPTAVEAALPASPSLPEAYREARKASQTRQSLDAAQAAVALQRAADEARERATALGANPTPSWASILGMASADGSDPLKPAESEAPAWTFKPGMRLRNWLKLPGELNDQILQGSDDEAPEAYRHLIKSYFNEVSKRGGEE